MDEPNQTTSDSINQDLVKFILEARRRGFDDWQIRAPLVRNRWPESTIECAFLYIKRQEELKKKIKTKSDGRIVYKYKNTITVHLDSEIMKLVEKRARKNMLTPQEQIEDIVRRSCVNVKKTSSENEDKVDDVFLKLFSRKKSGVKKV